jgi:glycosyltransferase involved in cell wall biosynthesis
MTASDRTTVVYLTACAELGGAERSLIDMMTAVRRAEPGWPLHLVSAADGPLLRTAEALGVEVHAVVLPASLQSLGEAAASRPRARLGLAVALLARSYSILRYAWRLRQTVRALRPSIVHSNGVKMHVLSAAAPVPGAAVIWHLHEYVSGRRLAARFLRLGARRCQVAVANSSSVAADAVPQLRGVSVRVVRNAVDLTCFRKDGETADLDALSGLPHGSGRLRIGLLAAFGRWKGHEVFLKALAQLPAERVRGYVIGGPIYRTAGSQFSREELQQLADRLGLQERVGFTGFVSRPETALRGLDVMVHASTSPEPFGLAIVEAMATGLPVVVSRSGGAAEIVEDEKDALTFEPGDVFGLVRQLRRLVDDPALRRRLGDAARQTVELRFDRARLGAELTELYRSLVTGGPP